MTSPSSEIDAWRSGHRRVCDLVLQASPAELERHVPATPDWTARDLVSHMVGLAADVLGGDEPDDHNPGWTQAQVDARRGRSGVELVEEWRGLADDLAAWMADHGTRPLNDVLIHEQDLRGALRRAGARDAPGVDVVRRRMAGRLGTTLGEVPALGLVGPTWQWASRGAAADADTVLEASDFDLLRALCSRRTAEQLRGWTTRGDVTAYLPALAGLGDLPTRPLAE
ncbi:hypothetical protein ASG49_06360 [Marmoricola sp. Leaf446]|uniref:maleylpyruvate isomerase N-terminal domain-containing protein n=1 Tax=Marmoricola sp. Leaf446 TaxID=1736379 RepID=UPI0006FFC160|nr:hypothetical protein [Marmoricola sp. Leaf446]KQT94489.1 hypothetical protein ASG49_06360 [Marmoricola sp. Leaf446]